MALISFAVTAKLICVFVFAYADCWFSHEAAHMQSIVYNYSMFSIISSKYTKFCGNAKEVAINSYLFV